jgi:hypothetical protein
MYDDYMNIWNELKHLFETDDGSLPDIFISNLTDQELIAAYEWLSTQCDASDQTTVWSKEKNQDILLNEIRFPARAFCDGQIESFHHWLKGLSINGVTLPELSICLFPNELVIDYRMGAEWNEENVLTLFALLRRLQQIAPQARISQADEGGYKHPNIEFTQALEAYSLSIRNFHL